MKPTNLLIIPDEEALEIQEFPVLLNIKADMLINTNLLVSEEEDGYTYGNWKIEPFVGFKVTLQDNSTIIIQSKEELEKFGISYFETKEIIFEGQSL